MKLRERNQQVIDRATADNALQQQERHVLGAQVGGGGGGVGKIVLVFNDGGVAGDEDNSCTFTYAIFDPSDTQMQTGLASNLSPKQKRFLNTTYTVAPPESLGLAAFIDGVWELLFVFEEFPKQKNC